MSDIRNLDLEISESFNFIILSHTYKFKHPNSEELFELTKQAAAVDENDKLNSPFFKFISPVSEGAPEFPEIVKKMTMPHWKAFNKMIAEEMDYGGNQSTENS